MEYMNIIELVDLEGQVGDLANCKLPDPDLLNYYKRIKNRVILINQDIGDWLVQFTQEIIEWNRQDKDIPIKERKPIKIFINTDGGDSNSIMYFINICNLSKTPIYSIGMGKCYSAGGLLLMGLPKGNRYIFDTTEVLIHDGSTGSYGDTGKVIDNFERIKYSEDKMKKFILSHTAITEKEYDKNYRKNWWMDSEDAIKFGVADHIVKSVDEIL